MLKNRKNKKDQEELDKKRKRLDGLEREIESLETEQAQIVNELQEYEKERDSELGK